MRNNAANWTPPSIPSRSEPHMVDTESPMCGLDGDLDRAKRTHPLNQKGRPRRVPMRATPHAQKGTCRRVTMATSAKEQPFKFGAEQPGHGMHFVSRVCQRLETDCTFDPRVCGNRRRYVATRFLNPHTVEPRQDFLGNLAAAASRLHSNPRQGKHLASVCHRR